MDKNRFIKLSCISAKALGFTNSIANLSSKERGIHPSSWYGDDYNRLRHIVMHEFPELQELIPPRTSSRNDICSETYSEIYTYTEQIYQMLEALIEADKKYDQ